MSTAADDMGVHKCVEILSEKRLPPPAPVPVTIHYVESGVQKTLTVDMRLPTYFQDVVVAVVHDVLPGLPSPDVQVNSLRNAARLAYHTSRRVAASVRAPVQLSGRVFDTRRWEPNNIAHLLLDLIPFSLYVRSVSDTEVHCLFRKLGRNFYELLTVFGISPIFEHRRVEADVVKLRGTRGLAVHDFDLRITFDCPGVCLVPDVYAKTSVSSSSAFERVFLARRGPRSLVNQALVDQLVWKFGYKTIYMEDYPLREQLSIGAHARHVVAVHGAAMSLLVMNERIDSVIELLPPNNYAALFPVSLAPRVMRYEQIIPDFDWTVVHSGWPAIARFKEMPFGVDTLLLERLLSAIH